MLGNELFWAAFLGRRGGGGGKCVELAPGAIESPQILSCFGLSGHVDVVFHRKPDIILSIRETSDLRDCPFRNNLGDEDNASSFVVALFATDVESQIYLFEIGMEGNGEKPKKLCVAKSEAHETDISLSIIRIQNGPVGNVLCQKVGINFVVQHD
jgi:hypothetical protein